MKGLRSTLAARIFIIFVIILIVPLCINTLITYFQEYHHRRQDIFLSLELLGNEEKASIDQAARFMQREAFWIGEFTKYGNANRILDSIVGKGTYKAAFLLSGKEGICRASSDRNMIGQSFPELRADMKEGFFLRLTDEGVVFSQRILGESVGLLLAIENFLQLLDKKQSFLLPYHTSLVSPKGKVIVSSDKGLVGTKLPLIKRREGLVFLHEGKQRYAVEVLPPYTNFSILLDVPTTAEYFALWDHIGRHILLFVIAIVIGFGIVTWLIFRMARPLQQLCFAMWRIEKGEMEARYKKDSFAFELNRVGDIFNSMISSLIHKAREVEEERFAKETLSKELLLGGDMQRDIAPRHIEGFDELDIATGFIPAKEVGGDYYDLYALGEQLLIVIADGSGKGVYAGFFSLTLRGIIRGLVKPEMTLEDLIAEANDRFSLDTKETGVFVTAWFGLYDKKTQKMEYASCGHPPSLIKRVDGTIEELGTNGMALGVTDVRPVICASVQLNPGDLFFGFTDGITEAHNANLDMFGQHRLLQAVKSAKNPNEAVEQVLNAVLEFESSASRFDDQTVVAIQLSSLE